MSSKTVLYATTMTDMRLYTSVKTHRMGNAKSESYYKLWTLDDYDASI